MVNDLNNSSIVECPICNSAFNEFQPYGATHRLNALCTKCGSVERHRLLWLFLKNKTNFFSDKLRVLDIAPTKGLSEIMQLMPNIEYMSIDKYSDIAIRKMDITSLDFPDNYFDCIICYHVLEHIPDDRKAMQELLRVLKPGGWAILQVPLEIRLEKTIEGSHIQDPSMRKQLFGQEDHVRLYGRDYKEKLENVGFKVGVDTFAQSLSLEETNKYGLLRNEDIYFCSKKKNEENDSIQNGIIILKDKFICHLVYEHDFIQQFNNMIYESCDWQEHLFVVYANHSWDESKKYNLKNSYYINSFDDSRLKQYVEKSAQIIVHCLYTPALTNYLFQNKYLLSKVNWKLWGGDLYLYRQAGTDSNPEENEAKRKIIIKNIAFITSPIEEEYKHAIEVYGGNAKYQFASYVAPKDYTELQIKNNTRKDNSINILVGNSGYNSSNHIQAFSYLKKFSSEDIKIYCPLSYGDKEYTKEVCAAGSQLFGEKFIPLLDFIQYDEYVNLLSTINIAVMNHNRQQGVGNITILLSLGKKVYMQPEVTTFKCLQRFGVDLYDINKIESSDFRNFVKFNEDQGKTNAEIINARFSNQVRIKAWQKIFSNALNQKNTLSVNDDDNGKNNTISLHSVLFVNHNIPPYEYSGTPISTLNHVQGLHNKGIRTAVIIPSDEVIRGYKKEVLQNYTLYKLPRLDKYDAFLGKFDQSILEDYKKSIQRILNDFDPSVVQINDYVYLPSEIIPMFKNGRTTIIRNVCNDEEICHHDYPVTADGINGKLCSGPDSIDKCFNCFLHNKLNVSDQNIASNEADSIKRGLIKRLNQIRLNYESVVDGVIFTESKYRNHFCDYVKINKDKIRIIPRGFDQEKIGKSTVTKKLNEAVTFGYFGHLVFNKGIDVVLNAFEKVAALSNFKVVIYGEIVNGEYIKWIERLSKKYPGKIVYGGVYRAEDLSSLTKQIDISLLPTYFDSYNRVLRELLIYGVPSIVTDFYGSSIIQHGINGLRIKVGDFNALAEQMSAIINNPGIISSLSHGAIHTEIPSLNNELASMAKLYEDLLKNKEVALADTNSSQVETRCKYIAFYLPQYHPIPENDEWWGNGFTEWTNVRKATPLYNGHHQPHVPGKLGYYDLRNKNDRERQAQLAKEYGIDGFCYWHYWFEGKRLLERPFNEVLESKTPDFPFCLAWANETWSRRWLGEEKDILIAQTYSEEDDFNHAKYLVNAFNDNRYIRIKGRPLFLIYRPTHMPDAKRTTEILRSECLKAGLQNPYLVGVDAHCSGTDLREFGFDSTLFFMPQLGVLPEAFQDAETENRQIRNMKFGIDSNKLKIYDYNEAMDAMVLLRKSFKHPTIPTIFVGWDNTPRRGDKAIIIQNQNADKFENVLSEMDYSVRKNPQLENLVFINAWNEWAEGNHLEPDEKNHTEFLERIQKVKLNPPNDIKKKVKLIAMYLPQYHPIPENDEAWGKGFTEWTNVAKAKPLFPGHNQPHVPSDLGFYDLRLDDVRIQQAELAKQYGIYGFCYYYYWFNGKKLLDLPLRRLLETGKPDFPFCICWANENWTKKWDGREKEIIVAQNHNHKDDLEFINELIPIFKDKRYIKINNKPVLFIYRTELFPDMKRTAEIWRQEVAKAGINDLFLVRVESFIHDINPAEIGFDAALEFAPDWTLLGQPISVNLNPEYGSQQKYIFDYRTLMQNMIKKAKPDYKRFRAVTPMWDNAARTGPDSMIFVNSQPGYYQYWLNRMMDYTVENFDQDEQVLFINAWNEWGEGNHLEPDLLNGRSYLEATSKAAVEEIEFYEEASHVEESSNNTPVTVLESNNDNQNTSEIKKPAVKKEKPNLNALINVAQIHIKQKNLFDAFLLGHKVLREDSAHEAAKNVLIEIDEKIKTKRIENKWNAKKSSANLISAEKFIGQENFAEAKTKLYEILNHEPENIEALNDLSVVSIMENNQELALDLINIIFTFDPNNDVAIGNYVYLQDQIKNLVETNNEVIILEEKKLIPKDGFLCLNPFTTMEFGVGGVVSTCCLVWTDIRLGNIKDNNIEEIWNSPHAQYMRQKLYNFDWKGMCHEVCPYVSEYKHHNKYILFTDLEKISNLTPELIDDIRNRRTILSSPPPIFNFSNSNICNLHCKMCTNNQVAEDTQLITKAKDEVLKHLGTTQLLILSGNGEPFARKDTRELLMNSQNTNPNVKISLMTNAQLLPRYWDKVKHQNFESINISMDAASPEVYEQIRIGGRWKDIIEALDLVKNEREKFGNVVINMTIMRSNYKEIPKFIDLAVQYGFIPMFRTLRGMFDDENIFEMNDQSAIEELRAIVTKENKEKRVKYIIWEDLVQYVD